MPDLCIAQGVVGEADPGVPQAFISYHLQQGSHGTLVELVEGIVEHE